MNKNLDHYLRIYRQAIDKDNCKKIIAELEKSNFVTHAFYNSFIDQNIIHEHEPKISIDDIPSNDLLMSIIWNLLNQYVTIDLKNDWYYGWKGYTRPRFNKYEVNDRMKNHCDHIESIFDGTRKGIPTLTILGNLNNSYQGGEIVMFENEVIDLNEGDIMIFPSNFLYPHEIEPVTSGVRYSFVSWCF